MKLIVAAILCASLAVTSADVLPLSVKGNQVLIGGKPGILIGNSCFWSNTGWNAERFYNKNLVKWLKTDWKSNLIRAAMGINLYGGYLEDPQNNKARLRTVIDAAIENDIYGIIDWHSHYAHQQQKEAVAFFQEMAKIYSGKKNVIYEICNEPKDDATWLRDVKPYALAVIKAIRAIDKKNLIVVGTPNWSQDVDIAAADPITGYENIAYALHFYSSSHCQELRDKATIALSKNIPLFVTEWGAVGREGNGSVAAKQANDWFVFLKNHNISLANWSLSDKPESASALKKGTSSDGGWSETDLTESGKFVRNLIRNWYK